MKQSLVSGLNKAVANTGIDITATKKSDRLRNIKRMLGRVFFSRKKRRHNRMLLTIIIATNVKQYVTFRIAMLAFLVILAHLVQYYL